MYEKTRRTHSTQHMPSGRLDFRAQGAGLYSGGFSVKNVWAPNPGKGGEKMMEKLTEVCTRVLFLLNNTVCRIPSYIYELMRRTHSGGFGIGQKYGDPHAHYTPALPYLSTRQTRSLPLRVPVLVLYLPVHLVVSRLRSLDS